MKAAPPSFPSSLPHDSAHTHVQGTSEYIDDRAEVSGELWVEVVYSPHAHANILEIDFEAAKAVSGAVGFFTAWDLHHNLWGAIFQDQPILAADVVHFAGEPVALVAATSREAALRAKECVKVRYSVLPPILSIADARKHKSFIGDRRTIARGDVEGALSKAPHRLEGRTVIRGADHFYLESQATIAYPREDGQMEIHSSSQHSTETQHVVAHALGLKASDVVCIVKRMGGGFGGKESQAAPFAAMAALVAQKLKRPARLVLTKDDDMIMTGKRNPFENEYRVGFDDQGHILALDIALYSDGGAYADLSTSIMERAMLHSDGAYFIPHLRTRGQVCRTHYHPHTAFRGFGGPKGVATLERIIEEIARHLGRDPLEIRKLNCYTPGTERNTTHYGQEIENNCLPKLLDQLERDSDYAKRRRAIAAHNRQGQGPLKGLSLTTVKFGISFTTRFLNQGNALVVVHRDGSIQVGTGATEMGQGVNARIAQVIAEELGLPRTAVRVMATSTEKNANTSPTAASSGTDINAAAAVLATRRIKARLSDLAAQLLELPEDRWAKRTGILATEDDKKVRDIPVQYEDPNLGADWGKGTASFHGITFAEGYVFDSKKPTRKIQFSELINEAFLNRHPLSEYAHYRFPGLNFNKITGQGRAFLYFTQGACASEVSIDRDTGEVKVTRVDLLMDLGQPINAALDLGQVVGAFVQGMGWVATEKLFYNPEGMLLAHSPSTYKIPSVQDTPRVFNVKLFENTENRANFRGTKAVGEPPLLLALSVWTAIHDAIHSARGEESPYPTLELPATQEEILRALSPEKFAAWE